MTWLNIECLCGTNYDCGVCPDVEWCKRENVSRLFRKGMTIDEIAKHLGVSARTVYRYLPKGGTK